MKRFLRFYLQMAINLASLFLSPQLARAEVIPKLAGYEQVTILKVEPDGIRIMHKDGIAKVPYKLLPKEMQEKLKFDPDAAKDFGEKVRSAQQEREMAEETLEILKKNNASVIGTIFQVVRGGILLENVICGSSKMVQAKKEITTGTKFGTDPNIMHPERHQNCYSCVNIT